MTTKDTYETYIASEHWSILRKAAIQNANGRCESCGSRDRLHGHHRQYRDPLESCTTDDIVCLCELCHDRWHLFFRSGVVKSRDFTIGFLDRDRKEDIQKTILVKRERKPRQPRVSAPLIRRMERIAMLKNDPKVCEAARAMGDHQFKLFLRKYFMGQKKKGPLIKRAMEMKFTLAKLAMHPF